MDAQREQELAAITPTEVAAFVESLAYWKGQEMTPGNLTYHEYPIADGRTLGLARRALEAMAMWKRYEAQADFIRGLIEIIERTLKEAVVDKAAGRVRFRFTGADLISLRAAADFLNQYDLTKQSDAKQSGRRYTKGKR